MKLWKIAALCLLSVPVLAQVQLGRNVQIGAGGGGACPAGPDGSVQYSSSGACAGDNAFTYNGKAGGGGPVVLLNQGNKIEVDGVDNSNGIFINGDQILVHNFGSDSASSMIPFTANQSDGLYVGIGDLIVDFDAQYEIDHAGKNATGFLTEPTVGNVAAGTFVGFQSGAPNLTGGSIAKMYGFLAQGGVAATTEEFGFFANTVQNSDVHSGYCDFMARTQESTPVLREKIGCGPTSASTFGGPVSVNDGTGQGGTLDTLEGTAASAAAGHDILYADSTAHCLKYSANGGSFACLSTGSGTPGGSNTQVQFNNSGSFGGSANFKWTGTSLVLPLDTVNAIQAGSGTPDPYTTWNFVNVMTTTPYPSSTYREATYYAAIPTLGVDDANVHWSAMNGFTFPGDDNNYHDLFGGQWEGYTTHAGNIFKLQGGALGAFHGGSGTVTEQTGAVITSVAQSTGSITTNYGLSITTGNQGTGTIGANYGIEILPNVGSGSITTNYGLHIGAQTGTTNYNLYSAGSSSANLFEGKITANGIVDSALTPSTSPICPNGTGGALTTSGCTGGGGGSSTVASSETVASSATPTFSVSYNVSYNVLTANVTTFTLAAGSDGQSKTLTFCQNGTGNFTVAAPANVHGFFTVGLTASKCSSQHFNYSTAQTAWLADSAGVVNE